MEEAALRERLTAAEHDISSLNQRVGKCEDDINDVKDIVVSIKEVVIELKQMRTDVNRIDSKVTELESKPAKRWDGMITALIGAVVGGLGTALVSIFLGG